MFSNVENALIISALVSALNLPFGNAPATRSDRQKLEAVTLMVEDASYSATVYELADTISSHLSGMGRIDWTVDSQQILKASGKRYSRGTIESALRLLGAGRRSESARLYSTQPLEIMRVTSFPPDLFELEFESE